MASFSNSQTICPKMVGLSAPVSLRRRPSQLLILLLSLGSIGWLVPSAIAQTTTPNVPFRNPDG
ncbi:MAG: hypothetical protein WBA01_10100, partial [Phormidesmis sp.]